MRSLRLTLILLAASAAAALAATDTPQSRFGDDLDFLREHTKILVLSDPTGQAQVAVAPQYQGRVMTSTAAGPEGLSFGWLNRELIAARKPIAHFNPLGGEDRFWLGPEGGQFSIFFKKGVKQDMANWYVPAAIDTEPFEVVKSSPSSIETRRRMQLTNASGTRFTVDVNRDIRLLSGDMAWQKLGVPANPEVKLVAYDTNNRITNKGTRAWTKRTGLLSIWILGMFNPSPSTIVVVPFKKGDEAQLGKKVNDAYFGKVPDDRLKVGEDVLFFRADGQCRSKIGIPPKRARQTLGSYDAANGVLTIAQVTLPEGATDYVNSMWEVPQKDPFGGDAINSYNDGPNETGKIMGPFYELESSSPAAALRPGQSLTHIHRTIHLQGPEAALDPIARATLGVSIEQIKCAFDNTPPPGFTALFNGKDLTGWQGLVEIKNQLRVKDKPEELAKLVEAANNRFLPHWSVQNGVLVYDGKGQSLQTTKWYKDFEMYVDWKILPNGDSGVYLRGAPQVQIWDAARNPVGSGGLYNNQKNPSKPLKCADRPVGEWNTFRIIMKGEKVTVWLNGELVVDNVTMENYWDRSIPIYPEGPIELQHHGNRLEWKNIYIKEL